MKRIHALAAGAAGAGLMYLLDPRHGRRRRELLVEKGARVSRIVGRGVNNTARDIGHRMQDVVTKGSRVFRMEEITDNTLAERVRSHIHRFVRNAAAVKVEVGNGAVKLSGPILQDEYRPLLKKIQSISGVRFVDDRLTPRWPSDSEWHTMRPRKAFWSPVRRAIAIGSGVGALLFGARRRNTLGWLITGAGVTSAICGASKNKGTGEPITSWEEADRYAS